MNLEHFSRGAIKGRLCGQSQPKPLTFKIEGGPTTEPRKLNGADTCGALVAPPSGADTSVRVRIRCVSVCGFVDVRACVGEFECPRQDDGRWYKIGDGVVVILVVEYLSCDAS